MASQTYPSANRKWIILLGCWLLFLSGGFANFVGSPGILQAVRLNNLLQEKTENLRLAKNELQKLRNEANLLENNPFAQMREIRRILGYAAQNELLFDLGDENASQ